MVLPQKVSLGHLADLVQEASDYFKRNSKAIHMEINHFAVSNLQEEVSQKQKRLKKCQALLSYANKRLICWINFESKNIEEYNLTIF